jgi:murein DD-endopeptidase MepM/ murein hydrolase activator NlpD
MTPTHRDLSTPELWERSLTRSRLRRALAPRARREHKRRKGLSAAAAAATMAGPGAPMAFAQIAGGDVQAEVAGQTSSARAIEVREGGLPLQLGSQGELVAHVQEALDIPADGIFGGQTDTAVRQYQIRAGLQVDGIVGPATWGSLFESGSAVGGSNVSPQVKERIEQKLASAARGFDAQAGLGEGSSLSSTAGNAGGSTVTAGGSTESQAGVPIGGGDTSEAPAGVQSDPPASTGGGIEGTTPVSDVCGSTLTSPVDGTVTSEYGPRWGRNHDGVDIAAPSGTPVRAAACGTVALAGAQSGYGNMVCITHSNQFSTCYAHLSRFATSQGAQVQQGQVIGYVGCTGSCTGPHLHFETRVNGQAQNPRGYMNGMSVPGAARTAKNATAVGGPDLQTGRTARTTTQPGATATIGHSGGASSSESLKAREVAAMAAVGEATPTQEAAAVAEAMTAEPPPPAEAVQMPAPAPVETAVPTHTTMPAEAAPVPVEPGAVPTETAPVPVEGAPVPVEDAPVPVEAAPVPTETAPVPVEAAPVPVEVAPVPVEAAPVPVETAPVPVEPAPVPVEAAPVPVEAAPVPVEAAPAPVEPVVAPVPVEPAPAPVPAPAPAPVPAPAPAPVEVAPAPAPVEPAPAPVEPAPVDPALAAEASADGTVTTDTGGAAAPVQ